MKLVIRCCCLPNLSAADPRHRIVRDMGAADFLQARLPGRIRSVIKHLRLPLSQIERASLRVSTPEMPEI